MARPRRRLSAGRHSSETWRTEYLVDCRSNASHCSLLRLFALAMVASLRFCLSDGLRLAIFFFGGASVNWTWRLSTENAWQISPPNSWRLAPNRVPEASLGVKRHHPRLRSCSSSPLGWPFTLTTNLIPILPCARLNALSPDLQPRVSYLLAEKFVVEVNSKLINRFFKAAEPFLAHLCRETDASGCPNDG